MEWWLSGLVMHLGPSIRLYVFLYSRKMICSTFRDWLKEVTGIALNDSVDMFCAQYQHTGRYETSK